MSDGAFFRELDPEAFDRALAEARKTYAVLWPGSVRHPFKGTLTDVAPDCFDVTTAEGTTRHYRTPEPEPKP